MSNHTFVISGYGATFYNGEENNISLEKMKKFMDCCPSLKNDIVENYFSMEEAELEDFTEYDEDYCSGFAYFIKHAIEEKYNIDLDVYQDTENGTRRVYLYLGANLPWCFRNSEKNLTAEIVEDILKEFFEKLYDFEVEIGDVYAVYSC